MRPFRVLLAFALLLVCSSAFGEGWRERQRRVNGAIYAEMHPERSHNNPNRYNYNYVSPNYYGYGSSFNYSAPYSSYPYGYGGSFNSTYYTPYGYGNYGTYGSFTPSYGYGWGWY